MLNIGNSHLTVLPTQYFRKLSGTPFKDCNDNILQHEEIYTIQQHACMTLLLVKNAFGLVVGDTGPEMGKIFI